MKSVSARRIKKEIKKRSQIELLELKYNLINFMVMSPISPENRRRLASKIFNYNKQSSVAHCRNHCLVTGRAHSIYRDFRLTRNELKRQALNGSLYGVTKCGW